MSDLGHAATESAEGRSTVLWGGGLALAAAATVVLILSSDVRLLRLGLIAALWAGLIGAFAVARLRERVAEADRAAVDRQRIYELELEREVAARREFEAKAEVDSRRRARAESAAEIHSLQAELAKLRETLEQVVGGDVLFERIALRAEATRVRPLPELDESAVVQQAPHRQLSAPPAAPVQQVVKPTAPQVNPPVVQAEGIPKTKLISQLSGQVPLEETRPRQRPRPKQQVTQAFPARPVPTRPTWTRRPEPQPEPAEPDSGAHAAGTSVDDLLAAYGTDSTQHHRHRRR